MTAQHHLPQEQLDRIDSILNEIADDQIKNVEALDGFFAAIVICGETIMPNEALAVISKSTAEQSDHHQEFKKLLHQFRGEVARQFSQELTYLPLLLEDENGVATANDWATGFSTGMQMRPFLWSDVWEDEEYGGALVPIMALAHEHDPDPDMRPYSEPISGERREELIVGAAAGAMRLYRYFRLEPTNVLPFMRPAGKVGRNDPCSCGSGRKYKKCCGAAKLH